jgi:predicted chitinase
MGSVSFELKYVARSAAFFWLYGKTYEDADIGSTQSDVDRVTRRINPGLFSNPPSPQKTNSIAGRRSNFERQVNWGGLND